MKPRTTNEISPPNNEYFARIKKLEAALALLNGLGVSRDASLLRTDNAEARKDKIFIRHLYSLVGLIAFVGFYFAHIEPDDQFKTKLRPIGMGMSLLVTLLFQIVPRYEARNQHRLAFSQQVVRLSNEEKASLKEIFREFKLDPTNLTLDKTIKFLKDKKEYLIDEINNVHRKAAVFMGFHSRLGKESSILKGCISNDPENNILEKKVFQIVFEMAGFSREKHEEKEKQKRTKKP